MQPLAQPPRKSDGRFDDWMYRLWKRINTTAGIAWALIDKTGANLTDIPTRNHNDLQNIQGGVATEYYHFTNAQHGVFTSGMANQVLHGSPTLPTWSAVDLTADVTATLPIANGGTNSSTALSGSTIIISNGTQIVQGTAGTTTTVLHGNASGAPTYAAVSLTADVSGILPIANGGTNASTEAGARTNLGVPTLSAGTYVSPSITDVGDGTVTLGSGQYAFYSTAAGALPITIFTIAGANYALTDNTTNYVVANYNGGSPTITVLTSTATINHTTITPIITVYRAGTHLDILDWDGEGAAAANKIVQRLARTNRFVVEPNGLTLGEVATRRVTTGAGVVWNGIHNASLDAYSSATDSLALYAHVAGVWTKSTITQYDNTQYDNGTNLVALGGGKYAVNWVFRAAGELEKECYIVLGQGDYNLGQAQTSALPASLPAEITAVGIFVGRIIVSQGAATATQIDQPATTTLSLIPTTDHAVLSNLLWTSSGHTGTANTIAAFSATGAASELSLSEILSFAAAHG